MSGSPVVVFDSVWKKFQRGERHDSLRDLIPAAVRRLRGQATTDQLMDQEFWALKDVSFEVARGEALGIIGPNGAGKSTALKLLTRILKPTRGACSVSGRVGALIEVAAGFHADLTGRENVFLQGAIMGMSRNDMQRRFDEIVNFSGVEAFIDTPVKRYSSGMQARLGFAVAAHLEPDVLFVDEVLSVGDMSFQARCMAKMEAQLRAGTTVVFVSHNMQAVSALCTRCMVLANSTKLFDGPTGAAIEQYVKAAPAQSTAASSFVLRTVRFESVDGDDSPGRLLPPHARCRLIVEIESLVDTAPWCLGFVIERTSDLFYCYGASSEELGLPLFSGRRGEVTRVEIDFVAHFARGHYRVNVSVRDPRAAIFRMTADGIATFGIDEQITYSGVVDVEAQMAVTSPSLMECTTAT